jgi:transposase InsO family protein
MTLEESVLATRRQLLRAAEQSGNVSATCRLFNVSRAQFYEWRAAWQRYGVDGLRPKPTAARPGRPVGVALETEHRVIAVALAWPTRGARWVSAQLAEQQLPVAATTVWRILQRHGLSRREARLAAVEYQGAATTGVLTERVRKRVARHVAANAPGDLLSIDTFYVGRLKGVGKVWQITACDAACSYGWARVQAGEITAAAVLAFLQDVVLPVYARAAWTLRRVLTDRGKEFKGAFDAGLQALGIRHTRTKPRHAWTNGFVERFQGTILHEHWRLVFRRTYFRSVRQLQTTLDTFLAFYNRRRPHQGYRLKGRTPAMLFWGASAA